MMSLDRAEEMPVDWPGRKFGIFGDNRGLSASRKQGPSESDGKQPNDVPNSRGRNQGRVKINTVCFNVDARSSGTADGRHVASPTRAPNPSPNPTGNHGAIQ